MYTKRKCVFYGWDREPLTERHVQAIWYDAVLRPKNILTTDGEEVNVVYPGDWNLAAGPDFHNAVLEIGPEHRRVAGDVEVHLSPLDWEAHSHGSDGAYRNVIAHVTWLSGPRPNSLPKDATTIWLGQTLAMDPRFSPDIIDLDAYPFARLPENERPCYHLFKENPKLAAEVLSSAGACRLQIKADRMGRLLADGERAQVFYEEVMAAFGYRKNTEGFRAVARAVPLSILRAEPENASAALLTAALFTEWERANIRPNNQPEVRLQAAADFFTQTHALQLIDMDDFSPEGYQTMLKTLTKEGHLGKGRAAAIIANVITPIALAEGRIGSVPDWLPPEDISSPVRLTAFRLFGRDHNPAALYATNGLFIQGLIQIHRDFCLLVHPACEDCGMVAVESEPHEETASIWKTGPTRRDLFWEEHCAATV
jgi:hypothetical protein